MNEPCNDLNKFPDPENYLYQARGFSLAECYYQSVTNIYLGLVAGEPLAAPFAQPGIGAWTGLTRNAILAGTTNLSVQFTASDARHPLQALDLFVDGTYLKTVTNIAPQINNTLKVTLNGFAASSTVPANSTIKTVTSNLVTVLNGTTYQTNTKVHATAHGDRIELQSTAAFTVTGPQVTISASSTNTSGTLNTFIFASPANPSNFLDTAAAGVRNYQISDNSTVLSGATLTLSVTKTNNATVTVIATNTTSGATPGQFAQQFVNAINAETNLQGPDGLFADDFNDETTVAAFTLYANTPGIAAAQIKAAISSSLSLVLSVAPTGSATLTDNLNDLEPRDHLYIACGVSNLNATFPLATTNLTDGYHELAAVAYEGTSVHTQTRATQDVIVKNTSLSATLTPLLTGTNSSPEPTLQFTVTANTNNISNIQLFSTGGLLGTVPANPRPPSPSRSATSMSVRIHFTRSLLITPASNTAPKRKPSASSA